jgi:hypothetical protein
MGANMAWRISRQREPFLAAIGDSGFVKSALRGLSPAADGLAKKCHSEGVRRLKATRFVTGNDCDPKTPPSRALVP